MGREGADWGTWALCGGSALHRAGISENIISEFRPGHSGACLQSDCSAVARSHALLTLGSKEWYKT